ncbi:hypothetical protein RZS08_27045, partial [Arthrospira platensis SPKY1]|nr:hypothetical protein [Arthrospira platensis SPKY1]
MHGRMPALAGLIGLEGGDDVVGMLAAQPGDMIGRIDVGVTGNGVAAGAGIEFVPAGGGIAGGLRRAGQEAADPYHHEA